MPMNLGGLRVVVVCSRLAAVTLPDVVTTVAVPKGKAQSSSTSRMTCRSSSSGCGTIASMETAQPSTLGVLLARAIGHLARFLEQVDLARSNAADVRDDVGHLVVDRRPVVERDRRRMIVVGVADGDAVGHRAARLHLGGDERVRAVDRRLLGR
jgi:hypothetical protein